MRDKRTPKVAKFLLGLAVFYALLPFDIIPDFIPVIGHLDDFIIVPVLIIMALKMIPTEVVEDCKVRASGALQRSTIGPSRVSPGILSSKGDIQS